MTEVYPLWYDSICISTSIIYALISCFILTNTKNLNWSLVILSGVISVMFRVFRLCTSGNKVCSIKWNSVCSYNGLTLWSLDVFFAVLSFLFLAREPPISFTVMVVLLCCVAWCLHGKNFQKMSCVVHTVAHIWYCFVLAYIAKNIYNKTF